VNAGNCVFAATSGIEGGNAHVRKEEVALT